MAERIEWYQEGLDDPQWPSNQGRPFKSWDAYDGGPFGPVRPDRVMVFPGDPRGPEANLVGSLTNTGKHMPVIDVDLPIRAVPSKTPGHFHLYIDREMDTGTYLNLLRALAEAGIVEWGYFHAALNAQCTFVRKAPEARPDRGLDESYEPVTTGPVQPEPSPLTTAYQWR